MKKYVGALPPPPPPPPPSPRNLRGHVPPGPPGFTSYGMSIYIHLHLSFQSALQNDICNVDVCLFAMLLFISSVCILTYGSCLLPRTLRSLSTLNSCLEPLEGRGRNTKLRFTSSSMFVHTFVSGS